MDDYRQDHIRNFCIIAHIDHGKSTLADRILEATGAVEDRDMQDQLLDTMEIESVLALEAHDAVLASAKQGIGIEDILDHVVHKIPPPSGDPRAPLRALVFDSHFDAYQGVVCYLRIVDGALRPGQRIRFMAT